MDQSILKKITLLNQTTLYSLEQVSNLKIIEQFIETGLKILEADFGFAWWTGNDKDKYKLIYKSSGMPYKPKLPREKGGNFEAIKKKSPIFIEQVIKENYEKGYDVSPYMKSYVIIPITYKDYLYGSLVLCFKEKHIFTEEDRGLSVLLGNTTAQTITISHFIEKEYEALKKAEILRNMGRLFHEEKLKTEFIANMAHELRTPVAIIKGNVDLAIKTKKGVIKSPQSALRAINYEIKHLSRILSDLSDITSRSWELKNEINNEAINLGSMINKVVERCKTFAHKKNISVTSTKIPGYVVWGDKIYLEKMLMNLVKNSITYGKKNGHTKITTKKTAEFITINVIDNGIGISKEDLPYVFERFYRGDKSHNIDGNHAGLGLAIVKWIVEIHGGKISVKSSKNKGSIFSIVLPTKK